MALKSFLNARDKYINPRSTLESSPTGHEDDLVFELDEAGVWNSSNVVSLSETKKAIPRSRSSKKMARKIDMVAAKDPVPVMSASLPINIPDWSKIYRDHNCGKYQQPADDTDFDDDDDDDDDQDDKVPPHEYLARLRGDSFSVHEGIGRTLKGRDLRQVRNAIWKRVGFED